MVSQKSSGARRLEVIVTSVEEAVAAEKGGADRLELLRALETGGLTPETELVRAVVTAVTIPVRVMVRENPSMFAGPLAEQKILETRAAALAALPIDGLVMGWVTKDGDLDTFALQNVLTCAPKCAVTFHRAFEHLADPYQGLRELKMFPKIDRILTNGGVGSWPERYRRLLAWSAAAEPEIKILVGGGLTHGVLGDLMADAAFPEIHVGRVARKPAENDGVLDRALVAAIKSRWS